MHQLWPDRRARLVHHRESGPRLRLSRDVLQLFGFDHTKLGYEHLGVLQRLTPLTRESNAIAALMA